MYKEKLKILEKLDQEDITLEEAQAQLKSLRNKPQVSGSSAKTFKLNVASADGDIVNVQIPIKFAKMLFTGKKRFIHSEKIDNIDIDIDLVFEMIDSGEIGELVNIQSADGDTVRICVE